MVFGGVVDSSLHKSVDLVFDQQEPSRQLIMIGTSYWETTPGIEVVTSEFQDCVFQVGQLGVVWWAWDNGIIVQSWGPLEVSFHISFPFLFPSLNLIASGLLRSWSSTWTHIGIWVRRGVCGLSGSVGSWASCLNGRSSPRVGAGLVGLRCHPTATAVAGLLSGVVLAGDSLGAGVVALIRWGGDCALTSSIPIKEGLLLTHKICKNYRALISKTQIKSVKTC